MALQTFPFNGTSGSAATTGNTGANTLTVSAGCSATLLSGAAFQGSTGIEFVTGTTGFSNATFNLVSSATSAAFSFRVKIPATPPSITQTFLQVNDTANARILQVQYTGSGILKINDKSNVSTTILTAVQATAGSSFRIELVISALSATAGAFTARAYSTGTTQVGSTATSATANTGTANINGATIGVLVSGAAFTADLDSLQMNGGSTTEIGEYVPASNPPVVNAGSDRTVNSGATVTLTGTATDSDGTIASQLWTSVSSPGAAPTISNASSLTASFVAPATAGAYVFQLAATDNTGVTASDQVTITVVGAAPVVRTTVTTDQAIIDARASTGSGSLSYAITPTGGTSALAPGVWMVPTGITYTVTVTDGFNQTTPSTIVIAAAALAVRTQLRRGGAWVTG